MVDQYKLKCAKFKQYKRHLTCPICLFADSREYYCLKISQIKRFLDNPCKYLFLIKQHVEQVNSALMSFIVISLTSTLTYIKGYNWFFKYTKTVYILNFYIMLDQLSFVTKLRLWPLSCTVFNYAQM